MKRGAWSMAKLSRTCTPGKHLRGAGVRLLLRRWMSCRLCVSRKRPAEVSGND